MANTVTLATAELFVASATARGARKLSAIILSEGWTRLRVGVRIKPSDSGANLTGTPRFGLGLCAGSSNILGDATPDHFVGIITNDATWTRSTSQTRYTVNPVDIAKNVDGVLTTGSSISTTLVLTTGFWKLLLVDITKGSPNFTVNMVLFPNANSTTDASEANFLAKMMDDVPAFTNHTAGSAQTIAVNEGTDGTLDHVNFWWDNATAMNLADIAVRRFS